MYCPFLRIEVELSDERSGHIAAEHPELLPDNDHLLIEVLQYPDSIRSSSRQPNAYLFSKWYGNLLGGKYVVLVVVRDVERAWVVTAYVARKLSGGEIIWIPNN